MTYNLNGDNFLSFIDYECVKCQFNQSIANWLQREGFIQFYNKNLYVRFSTEAFSLKRKPGSGNFDVYLPISNISVS